MIKRQCLAQRTAQSCLIQSSCPTFIGRTRYFHLSCLHNTEHTVPNHYDTLDVPHNASAGEIKRQFYKLSKANHPDLHPNDPEAASRFVKISEAHAVLGSVERKATYDRDFLPASQQPSSFQHTHQYPSGSFSSAGGRPASGLSRRRTQFRGPPPSFYRSGGWGEQGDKRAEHASRPSHAAGPAGTGPGGFTSGFDNDVRHFDQQGHYRTHSDIERTRHRARRKYAQTVREDDLDYGGGGGSSMMVNFFVISGVLAVIFGFSGALSAYGAGNPAVSVNKRQKEDSK